MRLLIKELTKTDEESGRGDGRRNQKGICKMGTQKKPRDRSALQWSSSCWWLDRELWVIGYGMEGHDNRHTERQAVQQCRQWVYAVRVSKGRGKDDER
jgi:hypothetical protein